MATLAFGKAFEKLLKAHENNVEQTYWQTLKKAHDKGATFDARAFILPKEEVCNYFIWRQQDATRNSIQMVGQANFLHKELQGKNCNEIQDMLFLERGINWNNLSADKKRGCCVIRADVQTNGVTRRKWQIDENTPIFSHNKEYIDKYVIIEP